MSSFKRPAGGAAGGRGKAAKPEPPAEPQYLRGVTVLAAPSIRRLQLEFQIPKVASVGGRMVVKLSDCGSAGPTHVVVKDDSFLEDAEAERAALGAPPSARLVTYQWVRGPVARSTAALRAATRLRARCSASCCTMHAFRLCPFLVVALTRLAQLCDSHAGRNMRDTAVYEPRRKPIEVAPTYGRAESPEAAWGDDSQGGAGGAAGGAVGQFEPPPPSGEVCVKEGCGRQLLWNETGPRCGACLLADRASPLVRMLHLRFLIHHPNAEVVAALNELADYEEVTTHTACDAQAEHACIHPYSMLSP
jgi:hypothetical protein